jgi:hypothetical protein
LDVGPGHGLHTVSNPFVVKKLRAGEGVQTVAAIQVNATRQVL